MEYIEVDIKGLQDLSRRVDELGKFVKTKCSLEMTKSIGSAFARAVRKNCPVDEEDLKKSIRNARILKNLAGRISYRVGFSTAKGKAGWRAHLVEFGTAPHLIPKSGRPIPMTIGGNVFMGPIQHPGARPSRFVTRSFEETYGKAIMTGQRAFERIYKKFNWKH